MTAQKQEEVVLPNIEFLIAAGSPPNSFNEAVSSLHDRSVLFTDGWTSGRLDQVKRASRDVSLLFDHIVGALMRARDDIKNGQRPANNDFLLAIQAPAGQIVTPVTSTHQSHVLSTGHGNGTLPAGMPAATVALEQALNKIKHQNEAQANFRIDGRRHMLVICANKQNGSPDCVMEFDVQEFCRLCQTAWDTL